MSDNVNFKIITNKLNGINHLIKHNSFIKNVLTLASGTAFSQLTIILFAPLITRLYGPDAFGLLGVFTSITAVLLPISALTYPIAIVLPKEDKEAYRIILLSLIISFFVATLLVAIFFVLGDKISSVFQLETIEPYFLFLPFIMFVGTINQVLEQWMIRKKDFRNKAKISVTKELLLNFLKAIIGFFYPFGSTLIVTSTIGHVLKASMLFKVSKVTSLSKLIKSNLKKSTFKELMTLSKKYKDFPYYRAPEVFINAISKSMPIIILATLFGPAQAGFYTIGKKMLAIPSQLIGKSVGDVLFPLISDKKNDKQDISHLLVKSTISLVIVGIVPFGLIFIFGPNIFSLIFGPSWYTAGEYARWMSVWSFFGFVNTPSVKTLPVISAQHILLIFAISAAVLRALALLTGGILFANDVTAIMLYSIIGALLNIILIIYSIYLSKKNYYFQQKL